MRSGDAWFDEWQVTVFGPVLVQKFIDMVRNRPQIWPALKKHWGISYATLSEQFPELLDYRLNEQLQIEPKEES